MNDSFTYNVFSGEHIQCVLRRRRPRRRRPRRPFLGFRELKFLGYPNVAGCRALRRAVADSPGLLMEGGIKRGIKRVAIGARKARGFGDPRTSSEPIRWGHAAGGMESGVRGHQKTSLGEIMRQGWPRQDPAAITSALVEVRTLPDERGRGDGLPALALHDRTSRAVAYTARSRSYTLTRPEDGYLCPRTQKGPEP